MDYTTFLESKRTKRELFGFKARFFPEGMKSFQKHLTEWSVRLGRAATFASCGLGKSIIALTFCENVIRYKKKTGRALIFCPLAVAQQFEREAKKFGMKATKTQDGTLHDGINVTNYHRILNYSPKDFDCVVCDEAGVLKSADRKWSKEITKFMSQVQYRLLCTATPAPNDYMELGSSSEALGVMKRNQMLAMFFTNDGESTQQWSLKGHAKKRFWQWVSTWARAVRKPSDLGNQFSDEGYILPELRMHTHILPSNAPTNGFLYPPIAKTLNEQRAEARRTIKERCGKVAEIVSRRKDPCIVWCNLNDEGDLLEKMIPDAVQVAGRHSDEIKEQRLNDFALGRIPVLVTKGKIAGWGLNFQVCHRTCCFPTNSWELYHQMIRRIWRFGQEHPVDCHVVSTEGEQAVLDNMMRKEAASEDMYSGIIKNIMQVEREKVESNGYTMMEVPSWLR